MKKEVKNTRGRTRKTGNTEKKKEETIQWRERGCISLQREALIFGGASGARAMFRALCMTRRCLMFVRIIPRSAFHQHPTPHDFEFCRAADHENANWSVTAITFEDALKYLLLTSAIQKVCRANQLTGCDYGILITSYSSCFQYKIAHNALNSQFMRMESNYVNEKNVPTKIREDCIFYYIAVI